MKAKLMNQPRSGPVVGLRDAQPIPTTATSAGKHNFSERLGQMAGRDMVSGPCRREDMEHLVRQPVANRPTS